MSTTTATSLNRIVPHVQEYESIIANETYHNHVIVEVHESERDSHDERDEVPQGDDIPERT